MVSQNLAKIVRHFLYIFYRERRKEKSIVGRRELFFENSVETVTSGGKVDRVLWRLLSRGNSINSSRVLEASLVASSSWLD